MEARNFIRIKDVITRTSLSRSTIYEKIAKGEFPEQIKLGIRTVCWDEQDINDWMFNQKFKEAA